jgi:large subunit ribosomal protein L21
MYAVFRTGGKQFRAEPGTRLRVPSLSAEEGDAVTFDDVLLASDGESVQVGQPVVDGATVKAEVLGHGRTKKVIVFKRKRRKGYRRKQGHRQDYTEIRVDEIAL